MYLKTGMAVLALYVVSAGFALAQEGTPASPPVSAKGDLDTMPKWSEFPVVPTDVPTPADIKMRVAAQQAKRAQLQTEIASMVWDLQEPEKIATEAKQVISQNLPASVDEVFTPAQLDAFARQERARAVPPPVVPF